MKRPKWVDLYIEIDEACKESGMKTPPYIISDEDEMIYFPQFQEWKDKRDAISAKRAETLKNKNKRG